jgi:hypothetical protein
LQYGLMESPVKLGRIRRNVLTHNEGRIEEGDRADLHGVIEEINRLARIIPSHNCALLDAPKERAFKVAERSLAFPHLANVWC